MVQEEGCVLSLEGNNAIVQVARKSMKEGSCCKMEESTENVSLTAKNLCNATIGNRVLIESNDDAVKKAMISEFGFSFLMFFVGMFIGSEFANLIALGTAKDMISFLMGIIAVVITYKVLHAKNKKIASVTIAKEIIM